MQSDRVGARALLLVAGIMASMITGCGTAHQAPSTARPVPVTPQAFPQRRRPARPPVPAAWSQSGLASWYGGKFHGRLTASGERYDMHRRTAAHRKLPFGTLVRVTNVRNGRQVVVRINDRGPFVGGRVIDLSRAAAQELDMLKSGVEKVRIEINRPRAGPPQG